MLLLFLDQNYLGGSRRTPPGLLERPTRPMLFPSWDRVIPARRGIGRRRERHDRQRHLSVGLKLNGRRVTAWLQRGPKQLSWPNRTQTSGRRAIYSLSRSRSWASHVRALPKVIEEGPPQELALQESPEGASRGSLRKG
jgi:hypothetical protein